MRRRLLPLLILLVLAAIGPAGAVDSYTVATTASATISEHGACRTVTNNHASGNTILVPTKSTQEWNTGANAFINALPAGVTAAACATGASLRLREAASASLSRTFGAAGNLRTWTWSGWVKFNHPGTARMLFGRSASKDNFGGIFIVASGRIRYWERTTSDTAVFEWTPVLRDPNAWYHIVVQMDTTQPNAADRNRLYINGSEVIDRSVVSPLAQNVNGSYVNTATTHTIGSWIDTSTFYFDGYLAHVNFVDNAAVVPSAFGEYNSDGQWVPKTYTGSYGTTGFYLDFSDNSGATATTLGKDRAGSNNWTPNNISVTAGATFDSMQDSPLPADTGGTNRGNYATMNPGQCTTSLSMASLRVTATGNQTCKATQYVSSGKWYAEFVPVAVQSTSDTTHFGVVEASNGNYAYFRDNANGLNRGTNSSGDTILGGARWTVGVTYGLAFDADAGTVTLYSNGTLRGTQTLPAGTHWTFYVNPQSSSTWDFNFGQRPFGQTPPSGFKALNLYNTPAVTVQNPNPYFKMATWTGNGTFMSVGEPAKQTSAIQIANGLRMRGNVNAYLTRTPSSAGNRKTWTFSAWVKRSGLSLSDGAGLFQARTGDANPPFMWFYFNGSNQLAFYDTSGGSLNTTASYTTTTNWMHVVLAVDVTSSPAVRIYVDGINQPLSGSQPSNTDLTVNSVVDHFVGAIRNNSAYRSIDGYLADVHFVNGVALTPSSFGEYDADGDWVPKAYAGAYGTNGFHLEFADTSGATSTTIGKDTSGNNNNFTPSAISVTADATYDPLTDTPTAYDATHGNFCTLNPLDLYQVSLSSGNLVMSVGSNYANNVRAGCVMRSGKWYWEATVNSASGVHYRDFAIVSPAFNVSGGGAATGYSSGGGWQWDSTGPANILKANNASVTNTLSIPTTGDVLMMAYDAGAGRMWVGKNGVWNNSGSPGTGANPTGTGIVAPQVPTFTGYGTSNGGFTVNFGQRPFAYTPPTGFNRLQSYNYSNSGFTPDLVIVKNRSAATSWSWHDRQRGVALDLESNSTAGQAGQGTGLLSFQNGGFTTGSFSKFNTLGNNYVAYMFKEGATPGFDIVTYTGNGTNGRTISHSLGAIPRFYITKNLDGHNNSNGWNDWSVYHRSLPTGGTCSGGPWAAWLHSASAPAAGVGGFCSVPTSSVFSPNQVNYDNSSGRNYIAYLFAEVEGFSKFGSYVGSGSTDGPFVFTGFKPAFVLIKQNNSDNWRILDRARNTYNPVSGVLLPSTAGVETVSADCTIDFTANGFKIRSGTNTGCNDSGVTNYFAAFAEQPFKYTGAR